MTNNSTTPADMTLRDYFAAQALTGMLADSALSATPERFASSAFLLADAMLAERVK